MNRTRRHILGAGAAWAATGTTLARAGESPGVEIVDDGGRTVRLDRPARRLISLAPNLTELVHAVGAGDRLVGIDAASNHPPSVLAVPRVGDHARVDVERLLALKPDLVLAWHRASPGRDLVQVASLGIPVAAFEPRVIDDVPRIAGRLSTLLGTPAAAEPLARRWREQHVRLREAHAGQPPVRVFYQVWPQPLLTIGASHLIAQGIELCGGRPLFPALAGQAPPVSVEAVAAARPEVIVTAADGAGGPPRRDPDRAEFAVWRRLASLPAVRDGLLFVLDGDLISRPGPRWLDGVAELGEVIATARRERTR
ncbi:MAG: helical backbone metal receptor [Ideonella sp.]|nr:helical backbone metal receptor [Ideonella sp.]